MFFKNLFILLKEIWVEIFVPIGRALNEAGENSHYHNMPYHQYLRSDRWQQKRKLILKRDKYMCQHCGVRNVRFNVHHLTYERRGYERLEDLITLCEDCHKREHSISH